MRSCKTAKCEEALEVTLAHLRGIRGEVERSPSSLVRFQ